MPLNFIDISSHQKDIDLSKVAIDAVIVKATEGTSYVNPYCDPKIQQAIKLGLPFGFYHYGRNNDSIAECDWLLKNTVGYRNKGIPVLDWEENQSVEWVNRFVRHYHEVTNIWPWIYGNPWRFNQGGVEANCARWIAQYPSMRHPNFGAVLGNIPNTQGLVAAWQFASDGRISGYNANLDLDRFYGTREAWDKYANAASASAPAPTPTPTPTPTNSSVLENDEYKVTVEKK